MEGDEAGDDILEKKVSGEYNTFRVYVHMLKVKDATAREVYRALDMSSPSLSLLHLEKLVKLGLVKKDTSGYHISSKAKRLGMLKFFHLMGRWFIPRHFFYFIFFVGMTLLFIFLSLQNQAYILPLIVALMSALINFYETVNFYRLLP